MRIASKDLAAYVALRLERNHRGFLEAVYQECLEIELELRGIPFDPHADLHLTYKGRRLEQTYTPDFHCFGKIIVEIKAGESLCEAHEAQLLNYLKATDIEVGLLLNFGPKAQFKRKLFTNDKKSAHG